jgi:hypothetical protein
MRDRALLRDLLLKTPQASPQELAQQIDRGVELGEKVAKAVARRGYDRPTALVFTIAGPSCPLFPLGSACGNAHCGHASLSA